MASELLQRNANTSERERARNSQCIRHCASCVRAKETTETDSTIQLQHARAITEIVRPRRSSRGGERNECCQYILCAMFGPEKKVRKHKRTQWERARVQRRVAERETNTNAFASSLAVRTLPKGQTHTAHSNTDANARFFLAFACSESIGIPDWHFNRIRRMCVLRVLALYEWFALRSECPSNSLRTSGETKQMRSSRQFHQPIFVYN